MKQMNVTEKQIGEATFYIKPFPAFKSANICGDLAKLLTPILGVLIAISGDDQDKGDAESEAKAKEGKSLKEAGSDLLNADIEKAMPAITDAISTLDGDAIEDMMKKLLINYRNITVVCEATNFDAKVLTYDLANEVFCGELQDMFILCWEVAKINFGGFFKKLGVQFGSPTTPTEGTTLSLKNGAPSI